MPIRQTMTLRSGAVAALLSVAQFAAAGTAFAQQTGGDGTPERASPEASLGGETDAESGDSSTASPTRLPSGTITTREVLVDHDETLTDIALRELGSAARAAPLADFNRLPLDAELQPGQMLLIPIHAPAVDDSAQLVFIKGQVELNGEAAERDASLVLGDLLRTGADGFATLRFSTGAIVSLQPETEVSLQRLACRLGDDPCTIELVTERGHLDLNIDLPASQPADVRVTTPYASAAVRGTRFVLIAEPGEMRVAVSEGEVVITSLGVQEPLGEGFGSLTREGQPPGQELALPASPVFRNVPARVTREDRVRWWPLSDVQRYRASLSSDSAGRQSVAEIDVDEAILTLQGTAPGERYLGVRAIDDSGLPGLASDTRLVVAAIDPALSAPSVSIERQGQAFLVSVDDPPAQAAGFEIQLATEPTFDDPLGVDVGPSGSAIFRLEQDVVYARARQLDTPLSVSAYGSVAEAR